MAKIEIKIDGASMWAKDVTTKLDLLVDGKIAYSGSYQKITPVVSFPAGTVILNTSSNNKKFVSRWKPTGEIKYFNSIYVGFDPTILPSATKGEFILKCDQKVKVVRTKIDRFVGRRHETTTEVLASCIDFISGPDLQQSYFIYEISDIEPKSLSLEEESRIVAYVNLY